MEIKKIHEDWRTMHDAIEAHRHEPSTTRWRLAMVVAERLRASLDAARVRSPEQVWLREMVVDRLDRVVAGLLTDVEE
jgi:hypothetical protein